MLEHVLRLWHDAVWTLSATLAWTNTTKILDLLEGTFGVDLPKEEQDNVEVESVNEEEEEEQQQQPLRQEWPLMQLLSQLTVLNFLHLLKVHLLLTSDLAPKIKGQSKQHKEKRPEAEWEWSWSALSWERNFLSQNWCSQEMY